MVVLGLKAQALHSVAPHTGKSAIVKTLMTWSQSRIGVAHGSSKAANNTCSTVRRRFVNPCSCDNAGAHT
jgi:hypothetical protein